MKTTTAFTQSGDVAQRYEPYTSNVEPKTLIATGLAAETDATLTFVIRWKTQTATPWVLLKQLNESMTETQSDKAMERLHGRSAKFKWEALSTVRLEVRGAEEASHHNFVVIDGVVKIKSKVSDERLQVIEENQPLIFTLFFVAPTGRRVAASYFGRLTAKPGEMTTYVKVVQEVLDSLRHFEPLKAALVSSGRNDVAATDADSAKLGSAGETPQVLTAPKTDIQTRIKKLAVSLNESPWIQRRYVLELLAFWLGLFTVFFDPNWRILLPLPLALSVLTLLGPIFVGRAERAKRAEISRRSVARVMSTAGAVGLIGTQLCAILSVPSGETAKVSLWVFLSVSQLRIIYAITRNHLRSLKKSVESYLDAVNWVPDGGDTVRYEEQVSVLRSRPTTFGSVSAEPIEAEAESQISLLIRLYHGVIAAVLIVLTYFVIGERFAGQAANSEGGADDFIFVNNEGFTAALALLIILISTVAVQMFTDLAKQIRMQDERFESDVSKLAIGLGNYEGGLNRVWGHFVEYLPDVSRAVNAELFELWNSLAERQPETVRQIVLDQRPHETKAEMANVLVLASNKSVVQDWFVGGWFDEPSKIRDLSAARFLASRVSYKIAGGVGPRVATVNASLPADEGQIMNMFALDFVQDQRVFDAMQTVRDRIEDYLLALSLKTSRYLAGQSDSDSFALVIESCNALDIDASYFLDDRTLFGEIVGSAQKVSPEGLKQSSRASYHRVLRDAEVARVLLFAAWLSQVNSYVSTPLHEVLRIKAPKRKADKVEYTTQILGKRIPQCFNKDVPLSQVAADQLLTDPELKTERFKWLMYVSLQDPQSALHCLVRAAFSRMRRQRLANFETNADRWRARRILSLPIVPRYQDRVRHLAAVLEITDRPQSSLRLRSINDVMKLPTSSAQKSAISTWALRKGYVDCDFSNALRIKDARVNWAKLTARVGPTKGMRDLKFVLEDLEFKQQRVSRHASELTDVSILSFGNSAFDDTRAWYQDNDFRWRSTRENERSEENSRNFHNKYWRYHCLLSEVYGIKPLTVDKFRQRCAQHIREAIVTVDPSVSDLLGVQPLTPNRGDRHSELVITEIVNFCLNPANDQKLLCFFGDLQALTTWRQDHVTANGALASFVDSAADSLDDSGETSVVSPDDAWESSNTENGDSEDSFTSQNFENIASADDHNSGD